MYRTNQLQIGIAHTTGIHLITPIKVDNIMSIFEICPFPFAIPKMINIITVANERNICMVTNNAIPVNKSFVSKNPTPKVSNTVLTLATTPIVPTINGLRSVPAIETCKKAIITPKKSEIINSDVRTTINPIGSLFVFKILLFINIFFCIKV